MDEFEPGNALGSHAGEQKLVGIYVSLACFPPHLRAKLENIFLSCLCYAKHLKMFGNEKIFCKTIEDLNFLSREGLVVNIDGCEKKIYFECVLILGDNLGLNCICGFSQSFTATRYCRICTAPNEKCQTMLTEYESLVRTKESYDNDLSKKDFAATGIREPCVFNKLDNFHIAENMSVDFTHDFCEGIAVYSISKILDTLIKKKKLKLDMINNRIQSFAFNDTEKPNKPRPLYLTAAKKGGTKLKIKQSASEMLCLTRYLGLIIGDLIPVNDEYWKLYICLRKIVGLLTCFELNRADLYELHDLLLKHNSLYLKLFGKLKPKMHIWLHYVRIILLNGPVVHFSTITFERKNKELKEVALGTTCGINLPFTTAIRHQLNLCYKKEFCSQIKEDILLGPIKNNNANDIFRHLVQQDLSPNETIITLKSIQIVGKNIRSGTVIVTRIINGNPRFGTVKEIFLFGDIFVLVDEFETLYFSHYYHAYEVSSKTMKPVLVNAKLIPRIPPCLYVFKTIGEFISTRFNL